MAVNQDRVGKCRMIDALIDAEGYSTGTAPTVDRYHEIQQLHLQGTITSSEHAAQATTWVKELK